jgi:hypothetical protein
MCGSTTSGPPGIDGDDDRTRAADLSVAQRDVRLWVGDAGVDGRRLSSPTTIPLPLLAGATSTASLVVTVYQALQAMLATTPAAMSRSTIVNESADP